MPSSTSSIDGAGHFVPEEQPRPPPTRAAPVAGWNRLSRTATDDQATQSPESTGPSARSSRRCSLGHLAGSERISRARIGDRRGEDHAEHVAVDVDERTTGVARPHGRSRSSRPADRRPRHRRYWGCAASSSPGSAQAGRRTGRSRDSPARRPGRPTRRSAAKSKRRLVEVGDFEHGHVDIGVVVDDPGAIVDVVDPHDRPVDAGDHVRVGHHALIVVDEARSLEGARTRRPRCRGS